ncbi:hypothetical protein L226DRAFT_566197 [Lentinus tigrinus ALCF2SS1-7]|uniref:F-box domain-containing protein n=1 Tax=Lentinus tigrinus ALCF2SS1-6 TaxID=1328759 RepID=A0A5C2SX76_9APHY|nr:hypothetical protein L227DRAFT_648541 [Lentinus tigrinus ALCF2SS1-6]RPD81426.1 hypothetical protein L226DRAFT_566197 [Lentinus tigrinus ALCF2SS1-7]
MHYTTNAFNISQGLVPRKAHPYYSRKSKAKSSSSKGNTVPSPRSRAKVGKLAALKDMPAEIFYMIVGWLLPVDLIHLSRTSKFFRSMLMSRKNECLWKEARRNVPGLPDCPPILSEPRYAAFLFDQYCFACGIERSTNVDYNLALRFCAPCYHANMVTGNTLDFLELARVNTEGRCWFAYVAGSSDSIRRISALRGDPDQNREYHDYYVVETNAVRDEIIRLMGLGDSDTLRTFLNERREYVRQMQTHGQAVAEWRHQTLCDKHEEAKNAKSDRSRAMKDKLFELGYSEDDFPVNNAAWDNILNQPTKLNDRIWKTARPKLEALIEQRQQARLQAAFEARLKERQAEFAPYYEDFVKTVPEAERSFMPNLHDASALPCIVAILSESNAETPITLGRLVPIQASLRDEALQYIADAKRDLVKMQHDERQRFVSTKESLPAYAAAQVDAELAKASSLFICHHCPLEASLSAQDICTHWRMEHPHLKWNDNWPPNEHSDRRRRPSDRPKKLPWVSARWQGEKAAKEALKALDVEEDTSHAELDELVRSGQLVCACGDPRLPPAHESSWGILLSHVLAEQRWYEARVQVLSPNYGSHPGDAIRDNHRPLEACLMLLYPGEELVYPEYKIPQEEADEIAALMAAEQHPPTCKRCYDLTKRTWRFKSMWMPRDVDVLAHHMKTKHGKQLTKDLLVFEYFLGH